jgi:alpha-beta hydrolase superfamily lysophospholipase
MKTVTHIKKTILAIFFTAMIIISQTVAAQDESNQFEKTQNEIINLINLPNPTFNPDIVQNPLTGEAIADLGFEQVYKNDSQKFMMRDGKQLFSYTYKNENKTTIILLHGVLSSSYLMNKTAGLLREASHSEVIALDFRGHGQSEGVPGDVDYINQYVDDLSDVIMAIKKEKSNQKIILAGHSMGGGIILRYAMKNETSLVDGYLLFAPHLGANSPTVKKEQIASEEESFIKLHINRIIGLKMMNAIGETKYNNLPVLFFNLPETMPITKYSYRASESMSPLDYKKGLNAINKPLLVIVGSNDEAFDADKFNSAVTENSRGEVYIVENESHNGIRHNKKTMKLVTQWINKHKLQ